MMVGLGRIGCCWRTAWARLAAMLGDQCVHGFQIGRPGPGGHQMRGTPPVCMRTGEKGTGSMPVRQPLACPKL
jgi:hypothetical protein